MGTSWKVTEGSFRIIRHRAAASTRQRESKSRTMAPASKVSISCSPHCPGSYDHQTRKGEPDSPGWFEGCTRTDKGIAGSSRRSSAFWGRRAQYRGVRGAQREYGV